MWTQMVEHENRAKRDWEAITGNYSKANFYQGRYKDEIAKIADKQATPPRRLPKNWEPSINVFETVVHKTPAKSMANSRLDQICLSADHSSQTLDYLKEPNISHTPFHTTGDCKLDRTLKQFKYSPENYKKIKDDCVSQASSHLSRVDLKNIMTHGRFNKSVPKYIRFNLNEMGKNPVNLDRMQAVSVRDALFDPA